VASCAASVADYTVCGGYKFLLAPRGTAFFTVRPDRLETLTPFLAGWYAGAEPWSSIYGGPLRLSQTARRFDISPAWHAWVGQAESLELLNAVGCDAILEHTTGLAAALARRLGRPTPESATLSLPIAADASEALARAGIRCAVRAESEAFIPPLQHRTRRCSGCRGFARCRPAGLVGRHTPK
jgi:selenocysteine lyase/cysteine desulfurase